MKKFALIAALVLGPCCAAQANIIPSLNSITDNGTDFTWDYRISLADDQNAVPGSSPSSNPVSHTDLSIGSLFTLYDFFGYIDGSCTAPAGWSCTDQDVGFTPDDVLPFDDPTKPNITWVYNEGPIIIGPDDWEEVFSVRSIYNEIAFISFAARGTKSEGPAAGTITDNVGLAEGPVNPDLQVPLPSSLLLLGLSLLGLGTVRKMYG